MDRRNSLVSDQEDREREEREIEKALKNCGYPKWTTKNTKKYLETKNKKENKIKKTTNRESERKEQIILPYVQGLSEKMRKILKTYNIHTCFKPHTTIRKLLVHPKDKITQEQKTDCIYEVPCLNCDKVYIGETGRKLEVRLKEHKKDVETAEQIGVRTRENRKSTSGELHKSAITDHTIQEDHRPAWENVNILDRESNRQERHIREAIWIRRRKNTMNRDEGCHKLSHLYDDLIARGPRGTGGRGRRDQ